MRLVLCSDTHGSHRKLEVPDGDVFIHAGDFMLSGKDFREIIDFDVWLGSLPHKHKIVIEGNHDILFEKQGVFARNQITNAFYLENAHTRIMGLKFWGSPQQPEFMDWAFNVPRGAAIKRFWDLIPDDTDVLITHGPPHGIRDQIKMGRDQEHLGCGELRKAIQRVKPTVHVFGHIHGGYGSCFLGTTNFVNASIMNEAYRPVNKPIVVDIPTPRTGMYGLLLDTDSEKIIGGKLSS